jgi:DNA-binding transcriptional LysR family regulator
VDRLTSMSIFVRVVQASSFTAVADELGTTQSSVSKIIAKLEQHLGVQLLIRSNRHLRLTEVGANYYERCLTMLAAFDDLENSVWNDQSVPTGSLRVSCPQVFGERHVMPIVLAFLKLYPEVKIDLEMSDRFVGLVEEGFDLAIRLGNLVEGNLIVSRIAVDPRVLVAAPAYLERHGTPETPQDLLQHRCLVYSYLSTRNHWHFTGPEGDTSVRVSGPFKVNNGEALRAAVLDGLGIAMLGQYLIGDDVRCGAVKTVCQAYVPHPLDVQVVFAPTRHLPQRVRVFIDYLRRELRARLVADPIARLESGTYLSAANAP